MKAKLEIAAAVLLILLLCLSILNVRYMDRLVEELLSVIDEAQSLSHDGSFEEAAELVERAAQEWRSRDYYTHITIRHSEVDQTTELFYELAGSLREESGGESAGDFERLRARLTSLRDMERVTLKSVL